MVCPTWTSVSGAWLALVSSLLLAYPGWRASALLRETYRLVQLKKNSEPASDETEFAIQALADSFKKDANKWLPGLHRLLVAGLLLMVLSGILGVLSAYCS